MLNDSWQEWFVFVSVQTKESIIFIQLDAFSIIVIFIQFNNISFLYFEQNGLQATYNVQTQTKIARDWAENADFNDFAGKSQKWPKKSKTAWVHKNTP